MGERYEQELSRVLNVFENVLITLSCVSPASAVFIIVPLLFAGFGTASFLSVVIASLIGMAMALCWAELGAAYPLAGGDYPIVTRALGPAWGFIIFALWLVLGLCIVPLFALGLASYLKGVLDADPKIVGAIAIIAAAIVAILKVRVGALVTGVFLLVELLALAVVSYLGFAHIERPWSELLHPLVLDSSGVAAPASVALITAGVAVAIFSQNGFSVTVNLAEETTGSSAGIARATLWSLFAVVVATVVPITAVLLGAKSIPELGKAPDLTAFVIDRGGPLLNTILSLAIAGAIFNAMIAILIINARFLYSSGRDQAWPEPIGTWLATVHRNYRTPWLAVIAIGVVHIIVTLSVDVYALTTFIGAFLTVIYGMIALAAIASRIIRDRHRLRPYRMPLWPLPPLIALVALLYVVTQQAAKDMWIAIAVILAALAYYFGYLVREPTQRWLVKEAPQDAC